MRCTNLHIDVRRAAVKDFIVQFADAVMEGRDAVSVQYDGEHEKALAKGFDQGVKFAQTLSRSAAVPYADGVEASKELTGEEAAALVRARFDAAKKVNASSMTSEKQAQ
jgi:hypothetical protein